MISDSIFMRIQSELARCDETAAALIFRRFFRKLLTLSRSQFEPWLRERADVEGVVQSAYRSFFHRHSQGQFTLDDWGAVWGVLAVITIRKCRDRRDYLLAACRDPRREVHRSGAMETAADFWGALDREPTPLEAATLADLSAVLLRGLEPDEQTMAVALLHAKTAEEIAAECACSERTVRRLRARLKGRLNRLVDEAVSAP